MSDENKEQPKEQPNRTRININIPQERPIPDAGNDGQLDINKGHTSDFRPPRPKPSSKE